MKDSRLTKEVLKMAFNASSEDELSTMLKKEGHEFTDEEIKTLYEKASEEKARALDDEELEKVAGGCGISSGSGSDDYD